MGDKNKSIEENKSQDLDDILFYTSSTSSSSSSRDYSDVGILSDVETLQNIPLEPLTKVSSCILIKLRCESFFC